MSCKRTIQEWRHAIQVLNSYAADFSGMDDQILPILKYSYDNLKGNHVKSCFKYLSLFSEDYLISKENLIDYWLCEGFITEKEGREEGINQGYEIIGTLVRACLLEEGGIGLDVKMHDVVREMALWISSNLGKDREKCIVRAGVGLREVPKVENWNVVERMSLMDNTIREISGSPKCTELTTLFLQNNMPLESISGEFFMRMPKLVVLDLSENLRLYRLPEEISKLVSLKYLNLSGTMIEQLPASLQKLKKLMHLYLQDMGRLQSVHGISKLSSLRTLALKGCRKLWYDQSLKELLLLEHLQVLTIDIRSIFVLDKLFFSHNLMKCFQIVVIKDICEESVGLLTLPNLRNLEAPCFTNLFYVAIERCSGLKDLTWLLFAPNLIHLSLKDINGLQAVVSKEKADKNLQDIIPFGKLDTLEMVNLPAVESIDWTPLPFPCLREMYIELCPNLRKLPFDSTSVANIKFGTNWIERVRLDDEITRLSSFP